MRFDFYRASFQAGTDAEQIINHLAMNNPDGDLADARPRMGYERCMTLRTGDGDRWCDVLSGGSNGILVETSGDVSPEVVKVIRSAWPGHAVSRADVCEDIMTEEAGLFERLHPQLQEVVAKHGRVQAVTVRADRSEEGSSYRIGSRSSETFIRVYEKPEQLVSTRQGDASLRILFGKWVRAEVETKPQKDNRYVAASLSEADFWGLSRISRQVSDALFDMPIGRTGAIDYKLITAKERTLRSLVKQYGNFMNELAGELGTWADMGIHLRDIFLTEQAEKKRRGRGRT